jgi:hypothetical protein
VALASLCDQAVASASEIPSGIVWCGGHSVSFARQRSSVSFGALLAAALTLAVDVLYLYVINGQEDSSVTDARVLFVAGCLAGAAVFTAVGAVIPDGVLRVVLLAAAACTLLAWTVLGALSIGMLLLIPTILAIRAAVRATEAMTGEFSYGIAAAAGFAALAFVAIGVTNT